MRHLCERSVFINYNVLKANLCATTVRLLEIILDCFPLYFTKFTSSENYCSCPRLHGCSSIVWLCIKLQPSSLPLIHNRFQSFQCTNKPTGHTTRFAYATQMRNLWESFAGPFRAFRTDPRLLLLPAYASLLHNDNCSVEANQPAGRISKLAHATPMRNSWENFAGPWRAARGSKIITRCKWKHSETTTKDWRPNDLILNLKVFVQNHVQRAPVGPR